MNEVFGPAYATSVATDHVLTPLGKTIRAAMADGTDVGVIWRAVVTQYEDRIPARLK